MRRMRGSFYLPVLPWVRVRLSGRGARLALGPRWLRYHAGAGGRGISTGRGRFTLYQPLGRRKKR